MQPAWPEISTCLDCGSPIEDGFGAGLGCTACLLRAGVGEDDASQNLSPDAFEGYEHFGVYKIDRREDGSLYELGRGGMGTTYRALDTTLQRKVALKINRIAVAGQSKKTRERFLCEARATAALRHENVATVFQFGIHEETGLCFYAMELVEGETLEERVRRAGPLDSCTTIDIAQQVTAALGAVDECGLIHRDLKPANLMLVNSDGSELVGRDRREQRKGTARHPVSAVKIIDFGLANVLHPSEEPIGRTDNGFIGTPAFASPEQFENAALDVRSDIYSLGVTLWFALTGKTPFAGYSHGEIHRAQQLNALPIEQLKSARVPARLRVLLKSMLSLEPAKRVGIHELAAELRRCAAATLILLAFACFVFYSLRTDLEPPASSFNPALPEKNIAVRPFENLYREPDSASLANKMNNNVLTKLATTPDPKIGRTAITSSPFAETDHQTMIPVIGQYRTAPKVAKMRHRYHRYKRVARPRTLWDKLLYGWVTKHPNFVKKK